MKNTIEDILERVLTCNNCLEAEVESRLYHEPRWKYEFYEFNTESEKFKCRICGSADIKEEFETTDSNGNIMPYELINGTWWSADELMRMSEKDMKN